MCATFAGVVKEVGVVVAFEEMIVSLLLLEEGSKLCFGEMLRSCSLVFSVARSYIRNLFPEGCQLRNPDMRM